MDAFWWVVVLQSLMLVLLIVLSGIFSGSETALYALSRPTLARWRESGTASQKTVAQLMEDHHSTLTVILLGNNFVNILSAWIFTKLIMSLATRFWPDYTLHNEATLILISGFLVTAVLLLFCEVTPKSLAIGMSQSVAVHVALPLNVLLGVMRPVVSLLKSMSSYALVLVGHRDEGTAITVDEYQTYIGLGRNLGVFTAGEEQLLQQVFKLRGRSVAATMTPRVDMQTVRADASEAEVDAAIRAYCHRRVPVIGDDADDIVGVLNVKRFTLASAEKRADWRNTCVVKPLFVPEQADLNQVLALLREADQGMVLVVDEYGGLAGLLTVEDILEQVVGDLTDEYDQPSYQIAQLRPDHWRVNGSTPVGELEALLAIDLSESDADTVGGLVMELADSLPEEKATYRLQEYELVVRKMAEKRVLEVDIIRRFDPPTAPNMLDLEFPLA